MDVLPLILGVIFHFFLGDVAWREATNLKITHNNGKESVGRGRIGTPCCSSNVIISRGILLSIIIINSNDIYKINLLRRFLGSLHNTASTIVHNIIILPLHHPSSVIFNNNITFWTRFRYTRGRRA
jgi:NADPH-dependent 7-cyano-7-deazaguanine reductase QueF-like protein